MNAGTLGMTISSESDPRVKDVRITKHQLAVDLMDGRTIVVPVAWFPRLLAGTRAQRANWELIGDGIGIHWPELDEDISPVGLLRGTMPRIADRRDATPSPPQRKRARP
jgi:hypothetical protein